MGSREKRKFRLGLDIGIASVGWGIVDENDNIVDAGVRLFPEAGKDSNVSRRTKRGARRLLRRRMHRIERAKKLLLNNKIIDSLDYDFYINETTPYELRVKGLHNKLSDRELAIVLLHLVKRRGIHDFEIKVSENKKKDEEQGTKNILLKNEILLKDKFICELQLEKLKQGLKNVDGDNGSVRGKLNTFKTEKYVEEVLTILKEQQKHNSKITDEFISNFVQLIENRREYFDGPGKQANGELSPYGWADQEEWMNKLFGRCTYYPEEIRMAKNSYTSELFNLLNDLNNLTIRREGEEKLTKEEKEKIIAMAKEENITLTRIAKLLGVKEVDILGARIDKNEKALFTPLKSFKEIYKILQVDDRDTIDEIAKILTVYQSEVEKAAKLKMYLGDLEPTIYEELAKLSYTGSHSLSKKAMNEIMEGLLETSKNQMELFTEKNLVPYKMDFKGMKDIPKKYIEEWILSPVVKRSLSQTINVINEIHNKYKIDNISEVVIEMAREKNSDDAKKIISDLQKKNENTNKKVKEYIDGKNVNWGKGTFEKIKFWIEQDGICVYSGKKIPIETLLAHPEFYEIDHIIPRSISFDDSQNNKVLVDKNENQKKRNATPYGYLSSDGRYEEFKRRVLDMEKNKFIDRRKRENLLFEGDLDKYATKFIARNLVDTRYATREILIMLKKFYADNEKTVKVKSIRGSVTSQIRKMLGIKKEREICHNHHAIDALVMLQGEKILNNLPYVKYFNKKDNSEGSFDIRTGEILDDVGYRELFKHEYGEQIKHYDKWRYSHYVDKKPNRQLSDETIYSTRVVIEKVIKRKVEEDVEVEYIINKLTGIYEKPTAMNTAGKIKEFFTDEKKQQQLLMYHHDRKTFDKFMEVVNNYPNAKNPFYEYYQEHKKYITKFAKKDNGPPVFDIKYRVSKLGSHLDLSHKYDTKNKKVVMLSIPSLRADFYKKGENYKFVSVTYLMMRDKGKYFELDAAEYEKQKEKKEINQDYEFLFSLYSGDIFEYETKEKKEKVKFKGINADSRNYIEIDFIDRIYGNYISAIEELQKLLEKNPTLDITEMLNKISPKKYSPIESKKELLEIKDTKKQKIVTIGKAIKSMRKIHTNNLGVEYDSKEKFITKIPK